MKCFNHSASPTKIALADSVNWLAIRRNSQFAHWNSTRRKVVEQIFIISSIKGKHLFHLQNCYVDDFLSDVTIWMIYFYWKPGNIHLISSFNRSEQNDFSPIFSRQFFSLAIKCTLAKLPANSLPGKTHTHTQLSPICWSNTNNGNMVLCIPRAFFILQAHCWETGVLPCVKLNYSPNEFEQNESMWRISGLIDVPQAFLRFT